jgi:hypothetical protein
MQEHTAWVRRYLGNGEWETPGEPVLTVWTDGDTVYGPPDFLEVLRVIQGDPDAPLPTP